MKISLKKIMLSALVATPCLVAGLYFAYTHLVSNHVVSGIVPFDKARDSAFILKMFKDPTNWYWLIEESSRFSPELMIETQGYPQETTNRGNLFIDVVYDKAEPVGFTAYLKNSIYSGKILFLLVDEKFRGQGWGYRLLDHAVGQLKKMGSTRVELLTRLSNESAQRLYKRYGFKEMYRFNPGIVYFVYNYAPDSSSS